MLVDAAGASPTAQLWAEVKRCAEFLRRQGVKRGDVVTIQLPNRIEFPVVFFSLELIGAIANKINPDFRALELDYILKFSKSRVVCLREGVQGLRLSGDDPRAAADVCPSCQMVVCVDDVVRQTCAASRACRRDARDRRRRPRANGSRRDHAHVLHVRHHRRSEVRAALLQHDAVHVRSCSTSDMKVTDRDVLLDYLPVGLNWGYITLVQISHGRARRWC